MAPVGMARVGTTLALLIFAGTMACMATMVRAQSIPDQPPAKAAKKKAAANKSAEAGEQQGESGEAGKKAARDPAAVQKVLEAARKSLDAGKADVAYNQVNALITAGGLDVKSMARALALRGHVYKKQGKPAQAIADLQSALWLKGGLNEADRSAALQARAEAYREAGLGEAPEIAGESSGPSRPIATATVAPRPATTSSSTGNFFSNLFGGASKAEAQPVATPPAAAAVNPAVSSWSETTTSKAAALKPTAKPVVAAKPKSDTPTKVAVAVPSAPPAPPSPAAVASAPAREIVVTTGQSAANYRIQLVAVRSIEEAEAVATRVRKEFGEKIGPRDYEVDETIFGAMGKFYRVRIGPFADAAEPTSLCAAIRAQGMDCMLTK